MRNASGRCPQRSASARTASGSAAARSAPITLRSNVIDSSSDIGPSVIRRSPRMARPVIRLRLVTTTPQPDDAGISGSSCWESAALSSTTITLRSASTERYSFARASSPAGITSICTPSAVRNSSSTSSTILGCPSGE
jgi:hypothetical protein